MNSKNNKKKSSIKKYNPKLEKIINKSKKYQEIRKQKKIWFWLIFIPPIGIYKSFKYKAFSKGVNIFLLLLMILILILGLDSIIYPNRVLDSKVINSIKKYDEIGEVRSYIKEGNLDDKFFIYNVVTTTGEYDVYFSGDGKFTIEGINQISPERKMIFKSDNIPEELNDIYPEIIRFFNEEDIVTTYGNIIGHEDDTLENHQIIITDKDKYSIKVEYGQVVAVFHVDENGKYEKLMQRNPTIELPKDIEKVLKRNKKTIGDIKKVYAYKITNETIEYYFINKQNTYYKVVEYLDNSIDIFLGDFTLFK